MSRYTFRLPDIGEGIAEAEIVAWHVRVGERVEEDARLADMMTDKATIEIESPVSGIVLEVAGEAGERIAIGSALVVIEVGDGEVGNGEVGDGEFGAAASGPDAGDGPGRGENRATPAQAAAVEAPPPVAPPMLPRSSPQAPPESPHSAKVLASPAVRQRARDLGVDLAQVHPAEGGRVRHGDLDAFLNYNADGGFRPSGGRVPDETVRVIGLRRRIAEATSASKRHIPHFTYVEEFDVTALEEARAQLNAGRGDRPKLTLLPFLISAICTLMPRYRGLNAHYDDEAGVVTRHGAVHLGVATQTPAGLVVPVVRNAQDRNLWQLAAEIARLAQAARDGSIGAAELTGSTLTISSLGALGGIACTPVINRPEVAVIAPNRIVERPIFVRDSNGLERIEKRKTMNLSLSCDHRVIDGWDAASFAQDLRKLVEAPALILAG